MRSVVQIKDVVRQNREKGKYIFHGLVNGEIGRFLKYNKKTKLTRYYLAKKHFYPLTCRELNRVEVIEENDIYVRDHVVHPTEWVGHHYQPEMYWKHFRGVEEKSS